MGKHKNGTQPRIKRNRVGIILKSMLGLENMSRCCTEGMRKVAAANADHSTAHDTAARGHRSAAAPRTWRSKYTDTHKPEPDRQSVKKRAPAHTGAGAHPETICFFYGSGCGRMPRAQLAAISARVSRGIISMLTYPARISFGV